MAQARRRSGSAGTNPQVLRWLSERLSLPSLESWSTNLRTVLINLLFLVTLVVVLPLLLGQFRRDQVIIEPISVPDTLAQRGLTADVVASRVWDGLLDVKQKARTAKESIDALPDSRQVEFSFPDSGLSIESLVFHLRRLFNAYETRIGGEFVCADADCAPQGVSLRLRVIRDRVDLVEMEPIGTTDQRAYFADAGARIMALLDPFVAIAATAEDEPLRATILARHMIRARHDDAKWAHNLIGNIRINTGDIGAAIDEYRAALDADPRFLIARANLGEALRQSGDRAGARAAFKAISAVEPHSVLAAEGLANVSLDEGDVDAAIAHLLKAAEYDPVSPRYFARAGKIAADAGRGDDARKYLSQALEIDPGYPLAFAVLGVMYMATEDYESAEKIYRDAADYAPDDAEAQMSHGRILAILKDWPASESRLRRAVALDPGNVDYKVQLAYALRQQQRLDEALAVLDEAERVDANSAAVAIAKADCYRDLGRNADAIAYYRRFLELDTENSFMRPVAERFIALLSE